MLNPIKALFNVNNEFSRYENQLNKKKTTTNANGETVENSIDIASKQHSLILPKLLFMAINLVCVAIGVYKFNSLGLLPTPSHLPPNMNVPSVKFYHYLIVEKE